MSATPSQPGLYRPELEHDACGMGFLAQLRNQKSNWLVREGLTALERMAHRGASGAEPDSGDGAGVLVQLPHAFFTHVCPALGIRLPDPGSYGVGMVMLPKDMQAQRQAQQMFDSIVAEEGQTLLGWRRVPTDNHELGATAVAIEPDMFQVFVAKNPALGAEPLAFERKLYVIRKRFENAIAEPARAWPEEVCVASLSARTLAYKGMLTPTQIRTYFPDLAHPHFASALVMFHSRFSTNTFPSWSLAHPYRMVVHNGEINTLRGNKNWMRARENLLRSEAFGDDLAKVLPTIPHGSSDSASFDAVLELLTLAGRSLPHAAMMMIPEAWERDTDMDRDKRAFYAYHNRLMEPWDGPAAMACTDGRRVAAVLDRNGLRPSRYYVTLDETVMVASEVGVFDVPADRIKEKGRLEPGKMLLIDLDEQRIVADAEIKHALATEHPYAAWVAQHVLDANALPDAEAAPGPTRQGLERLQRAFGYTLEDLSFILQPMAASGKEAVGSMGNDTPLAVLSDKPQLLYSYFKQGFAQVTNPPLDAIREELVTSVQTALGPESNLLEPRPESCHCITLPSPFITNRMLARIRALEDKTFTPEVLHMVFPVADGPEGMEPALHRLFEQARTAIESGTTLLILSDRGVDAEHAAIPALLAVAGLQEYLVRHKLRTSTSIIVETGEAREVHHLALLVGYGATLVNPYLALESVEALRQDGHLDQDLEVDAAIDNYITAITKGVLKVMSKMGISTVDSYRGAQIFEAIGLNPDVIARYFRGTASRIGGVGLAELAQERLIQHDHAFGADRDARPGLNVGGHYQWRREGEYHLFNPTTVAKLQHATRLKRENIFREYTEKVDDQSQRRGTLRGLFRFKMGQRTPIPIDEVEPATNIMRRFATGAMSYGSISAEAHETLAIAMNRIGGKSNSGEGGEDPRRYVPDPNGDRRQSAIKQVASGRFGVSSHYLVNAEELQIKMAQGAKPGEGGQLPGNKVWPWIAKVRFSTPGVGLISPPPHHDIYSIEDLAQLIHDLKNANDRARINVKLVSVMGVGTVAAGVSKAKADVVLISGHDGGTGASPLTSLKHAGTPWELGLAETQQTLVQNRLRDRIVVQVDGQMKTGRDVVVAALLGAEEFGFSTAPLVVMGCIMMRVCQRDTCPVGIATQNPDLRAKFEGRAEHVVNFFEFIAEQVRALMAELGFRTMDEMIGRSDLLDETPAVDFWKARGLDLSPIFYRPEEAASTPVRQVRPQNHGLERALDRQLIRMAGATLDSGEPLVMTLPIRNTHRTVGTMLGAEVTRLYGAQGLPEDTIRLEFMGSAGQSFGAFVPRGMTLELTGDANDYVGKGLSGGKIIVRPHPDSPFNAEENIVIGNVALYGATEGEAYIRGMAGERFGVRNSGAHAVVEGTGDHGCEYMTGGRVVVLGRTGRNFAAGMSGGIAYVFDPEGRFPGLCNLGMVALETLDDPAEIQHLKTMLERHARYTDSPVAKQLLERWDAAVRQFVKVMPTDLRRVLEAQSERAA